jgi:parvulin-like peptidyl-prolyl isomerase
MPTKKKTTTKKSAPKTTARRSTAMSSRTVRETKTVPADEMPEARSESTTTTEQRRSKGFGQSVRENKLPVGLLVAALVLGGLLYYFRSLFVAATINGEPVSRVALVQELEKQGGKQALNTIVTKTLVQQEARKQNVTVSDDEVNAELKKIEDNLKKQGQDLNQVLQIQGLTRDGLEEQIRLQKLVEKMVGKEVTVTDKEVDAYIEQNKASYPEGTDLAKERPNISEQLKQQKLSERIQTWLEKLQKDAKIDYLVNY